MITQSSDRVVIENEMQEFAVDLPKNQKELVLPH